MSVVTQNLNGYSLDKEKLELLRDTYCKGATHQEFMLFVHACERTKLDPFMRQIHAVKRWDSTLRREAMTIQTGIDGYRLIAERTGCYSPGREPSYTYDANGHLESATAYVKKMTKDGTWHEVAATAFFDEYCQRNKENKPIAMWQKMARNQLAKCAEALCLRKAFPAELSGIYTKEEMEQAEVVTVEIPGDSEQVVDLPKNEPINDDEVKYLQDSLNQCEEMYVRNVESYYQKEFGINSWKDLPKAQYTRLLNNINKKLQARAA
jgi:phage recombination protein Bet